MDPKRQVVRHFLAALAYRTEKALRDAPETFPDFRAKDNVRTPHELLWHMTGVLGYARTFFVGGIWQPERISFSDEVRRFHELLEDLDQHLEAETTLNGISLEQLLQGPLSDAMTHQANWQCCDDSRVHQSLRKISFFADIRSGHLGQDQSLPLAPDLDWSPDRPPHAPGRRKTRSS